ncbi:MAG: hypothetical protein RLZZ383_2437 [Pseudomonadota bacterium]|jgi:glycosyltransferase involved in cell wall biosynthesis
MKSLALVIPCYNEAAGLEALVQRCVEVFAGRDDVEVILVDNGSTDDTPVRLPDLIAPHAFLRTVRVEVNQGYGHGILTGLRAADAHLLAWTHADLQTDPQDALVGLAKFQAAAEPDRLFVKGNRYGRPLADRVFTWGMAAFETALLGARLWDINAQPTMFSASFFRTWDDEAPGDFSLDLYAYHRAVRDGLRVERFPVHFGPRFHGLSRWNVHWTSRAKFIRRTVDFSLALRARERGAR